MLRVFRENNEGIVFVTVLMIIIIMSILTISIIGLNLSQIMLSENEVERLQAEVLATGTLFYTYANQASSSPGTSISMTETLDGKNFSVWANVVNPGTGPFSTNELNISISY